jgi:hypothetical protein
MATATAHPALFDQQSSIGNDVCSANLKGMTNESIMRYQMWNASSSDNCEEDAKKNQGLREFGNKHLNLRYRQCVGVTSPCLIDTDSDLRLNQIWTSEKAKTQLFNRFYVASPNLSKGTFDPHVEDTLVHGEHTSFGKQCMSTVGDRFMPLLPCLREQLNDIRTKVAPFKRTGEDSRQLMRDLQPTHTRCSRTGAAVPATNGEDAYKQECGQ